MALSAVIGMGGYSVSFAVSLGLDQPFGPVCAVVLVMLAASTGRDSYRM